MYNLDTYNRDVSADSRGIKYVRTMFRATWNTSLSVSYFAVLIASK
jgi:hypothetical protein